MNRLLLVVLTLLLAALGWQTWRLADASQTISTQADELQSKSQALAKSNSQLISLSILTETITGSRRGSMPKQNRPARC